MATRLRPHARRFYSTARLFPLPPPHRTLFFTRPALPPVPFRRSRPLHHPSPLPTPISTYIASPSALRRINARWLAAADCNAQRPKHRLMAPATAHLHLTAPPLPSAVALSSPPMCSRAVAAAPRPVGALLCVAACSWAATRRLCIEVVQVSLNGCEYRMMSVLIADFHTPSFDFPLVSYGSPHGSYSTSSLSRSRLKLGSSDPQLYLHASSPLGRRLGLGISTGSHFSPAVTVHYRVSDVNLPI